MENNEKIIQELEEKLDTVVRQGLAYEAVLTAIWMAGGNKPIQIPTSLLLESEKLVLGGITSFTLVVDGEVTTISPEFTEDEMIH